MRTRSRRFVRSNLAVAFLVVLMAGLGGCEAIFTYTPLSLLQRPPSSLPLEQRLEYAQNALASGDKTVMAAALLAIQDDPSPEAQYTAAQLGIEISGVPQLFLDAVNGTVTISSGDPSSIIAFLTDHPEVQPDFLIAAAARFDAADPLTLQPMDFVYGALGLALNAAKQTDGTYDFGNLDAGKAATAQTFIAEAAANPAIPDSMQTYLSALNSYV